MFPVSQTLGPAGGAHGSTAVVPVGGGPSYAAFLTLRKWLRSGALLLFLEDWEILVLCIYIALFPFVCIPQCRGENIPLSGLLIGLRKKHQDILHLRRMRFPPPCSRFDFFHLQSQPDKLKEYRKNNRSLVFRKAWRVSRIYGPGYWHRALHFCRIDD